MECLILGDGTSGIHRYSTIEICWGFKNSDFNLIEKLYRYCKDVLNDIEFKTFDVIKSSHVYRRSSGRKKLALEFDKFYTKEKEDKIPKDILIETNDSKNWFLIGFYAADGNKRSKQKDMSLTRRHRITISGLNYLCQSLV